MYTLKLSGSYYGFDQWYSGCWCGFECSLGTRPRQSTLPWPWGTTGLGWNGSPNVQSPRLGEWRPRLFGRQRLLATLAGVKSLPNVKELTGGRSHVLVHGFQANFLLGKIPHGLVSSSTKKDTLTLFGLDSCCACSSCCGAGPPSLSLATLGERILTIFCVHPRRPMVLREGLPDFGLDNLLNGVGITVLGDSNWSRGLVLCVLC